MAVNIGAYWCSFSLLIIYWYKNHPPFAFSNWWYSCFWNDVNLNQIIGTSDGSHILIPAKLCPTAKLLYQPASHWYVYHRPYFYCLHTSLARSGAPICTKHKADGTRAEMWCPPWCSAINRPTIWDGLYPFMMILGNVFHWAHKCPWMIADRCSPKNADIQCDFWVLAKKWNNGMTSTPGPKCQTALAQ